jgi:hypothetical protein
MEENNNNNNNNCDEKNSIIIHFFNTCGIKCEKLSDLDGMILYRNDFIFSEKYENIKLIIYDLKKILSSSIYTSLHSDAERKQRFPLINVIRQVLKSINYKLIPKRLSDGYTRDGIKKYKRLFIIEK